MLLRHLEMLPNCNVFLNTWHHFETFIDLFMVRTSNSSQAYFKSNINAMVQILQCITVKCIAKSFPKCGHLQ